MIRETNTRIKSKKLISKREIEESISKKLEEEMGIKFNELLDELKTSKNKIIVLDEKINILTRKLEKEHHSNG